MAVSTNIRSIRMIKSVAGDAYSVEHSSNTALSLCSMCGRNQACEAFGSMTGYEVKGPVRRCDQYMPPLAFRNKRGTQGRFNTFRLGTAWAHRLTPGREVALVDADSEVFGVAKVTAVYSGSIEDMASMFGQENHMLLDAESFKTEDMIKVLRSSYGNLIFKAHDSATVIYLER